MTAKSLQAGKGSQAGPYSPGPHQNLTPGKWCPAAQSTTSHDVYSDHKGSYSVYSDHKGSYSP